MAAAVNILLDCTVTMTFAATDAGGGETFSGSISFKCDKVSYKRTKEKSNHATAQDDVDFMRRGQKGWEMTFETKLGQSATIGPALGANDLGKVTLVSATGTGLAMGSNGGLIGDIEADYAGPSTLKWTMHSRGQDLLLA